MTTINKLSHKVNEELLEGSGKCISIVSMENATRAVLSVLSKLSDKEIVKIVRRMKK